MGLGKDSEGTIDVWAGEEEKEKEAMGVESSRNHRMHATVKCDAINDHNSHLFFTLHPSLSP